MQAKVPSIIQSKRDFCCDERRGDDEIVIGLVNIVPPSAIRTTERHFTTLLNESVPGCRPHIRLFTFAEEQPFPNYENVDALWNADLDGLIVTGTEPRAAEMVDEPYWKTLASLVDWAGERTISTIWSCFSAHAAVFRLNKIVRQPLLGKLSGVFECRKNFAHQITSLVSQDYRVPHSRRNGLSKDALQSSGYHVLASGPRIGVDSFSKIHRNSEFLFLQGHAEYSQRTLLLEYCRDVGRFLSGQQLQYPEMPENYLGPEAAAAFGVLEGHAKRSRSPSLLAELNREAFSLGSLDWRQPAQQLYSGWLSYIVDCKTARAGLAAA